MTDTNEFSFVLKPATHGVGVFAVHDIPEGTELRLFGRDVDHSIVRRRADVPEFFIRYCLDRGDTLVCPPDFGSMPVGWHLNHSEAPNAAHRHYRYFALRDIAAGEEITIDYRSLEEPRWDDSLR